MKKQYQIRYFKCSSCGTIVTASKYRNRTANGHIKTMYCYICREDKEFVQYDSQECKRK